MADSESREQKRAVVVLSGGLDSSTACAVACRDNDEVFGLTFDYGQTLQREIYYAERLAEYFDLIEHKIFRVDLTRIGGSALTDQSIDIPGSSRGENPETHSSIPVTYVPARNTIFLSIALAWAEILDAGSIYIGVTAVDYSGYPDCRPEYIEAFQNLADLATKRGVEGNPIKIVTPLLHRSKSQIIRKGLDLGVPYELTWSCYKEGVQPCRVCESCVLRENGFEELGMKDPLVERTH